MLTDLLNPLVFPLDPAKRIWWGCLLSSLVLASIITAIRVGRVDLKDQLRQLFDKHYWLTKSSAVDISLMFANNAIRVLVLVPAVGGRLAGTLLVGGFLQSQLGDAPSVDLPWIVIGAIFSLSFFIAEDASRFFLHFAMHRVPLLWRFHRVHHSAEILTPLTLFRVHPVEHLLYFVRGIVVFGLVTGFFVWLFGRNLETFDVLGVGLFGFLFNLAGSNLRHSHVWLSFGRLERWFVSPAQHQLHHSRDHEHQNLGSALAIWDRLMGTSLRAGKPLQLQFGLAREQPNLGLLASVNLKQ